MLLLADHAREFLLPLDRGLVLRALLATADSPTHIRLPLRGYFHS
jgi:hypothetical protein